MSFIIPVGIVLTILGLAGIIWSILAVMRARRAKLDEDAFKARLTSIMPINMGALLVSMLGLGVVIIGIILT